MTVLRGLVRPLVRTLIRRGVTAPAFYKLLKAVYVDVAHKEFWLDGPPTDSRITLLTGVHRKDVREILTSDDKTWMTERAKSSSFSTVLSRWMTLPEYKGENGAPRPLPRISAGGLSFEGLVRAVNTDIRPRTILDELVNQSLVEERDDGLLYLSETAQLGDTPDAHKLAYFASNIGDHIAAASENLASEPAPFFERAVHYNGLRQSSVDDIEDHARALAQSMLEQVNAQSAELQHTDRSESEGLERYRLGVYFYREKTEADTVDVKDVAGDTND